MSFFSEEHKLDLSGKSNEELSSLFIQLNTQLNDLNVKKIELNKMRKKYTGSFEQI